MTNRLVSALILLITLIPAGCGSSRRSTVGLEVDLYLHPTSADPYDILLQTAITKRLSEDPVTQRSGIHVRVEERVVILTGTTNADVRDAAERIARQTELTLNGESIRPKDPITNRIATR